MKRAERGSDELFSTLSGGSHRIGFRPSGLRRIYSREDRPALLATTSSVHLLATQIYWSFSLHLFLLIFFCRAGGFKVPSPAGKLEHPKVLFRAIESRSGAADKSSQSPSSKVVCEVVKARWARKRKGERNRVARLFKSEQTGSAWANHAALHDLTKDWPFVVQNFLVERSARDTRVSRSAGRFWLSDLVFPLLWSAWPRWGIASHARVSSGRPRFERVD